jgi:MFS family permease
VFNLPFSVWRLTFAYALTMTAAPLMVLVAGIIGSDLAPHEGLATLPLALAVTGTAASTLPLGKLQRRLGRRMAFVVYASLGILVALAAGFSLVKASFSGFCLATFGMGWCGAAAHQYRFAALELVPVDQAASATSTLLLGGILAALIGPEVAVLGRNLFSTPFAGSFFILAGIYAIALFLISLHPENSDSRPVHVTDGKPLQEILRSPIVILAISAGALGFGVMSFVMTATPISMHEHAGHSLEATKTVIQSHIVAMYLPSLFFAFLFRRLGFSGMLWAGTLALAAALLIALTGTDFIHYMVPLVLLGVGWNFLFLSGTNLLPHGHRPEDRYRIQSGNDFVVFSIQAIVTLSSGWVLFAWNWSVLLLASLPMVIAFGIMLLRTRALDGIQSTT